MHIFSMNNYCIIIFFYLGTSNDIHMLAMPENMAGFKCWKESVEQVIFAPCCCSTIFAIFGKAQTHQATRQKHKLQWDTYNTGRVKNQKNHQCLKVGNTVSTGVTNTDSRTWFWVTAMDYVPNTKHKQHLGNCKIPWIFFITEDLGRNPSFLQKLIWI